MVHSYLQPAEYSGCVVTVCQQLQDANNQSLRKTESFTNEKRSVSPSHVSKTEFDGQWSSSGVILDATLGIVLCHGAIFFPFLKKAEKNLYETKYDHFLAEDFVADLTIQVECQSERGKKIKMEDGVTNVVPPQRPGLGLMSNQTGIQAQRKHQHAQLLMLVPCPEFQVAFSNLFGKAEGWVFSSEEEKHEYGELQKDLAYLHWFAVLRLQYPPDNGFDKLSYMKSANLQKGSMVFACGSPFGSFYPDIFLNTISKGILSNMAGDGNVVLLTDARCLPGSEGGGIFVVEAGALHLVGIVVTPLCWKNNEWVGLTVACSIGRILENILKVFGRNNISVTNDLTAMQLINSYATNLKRNPKPLEQLSPAVVLVDSGHVWGSGVMITPKVVLTCRHVVRESSRISVKIRFPAAEIKQVVKGRVIFSTEESSPYDIAVVELEEMVMGVPEPAWASTYHTGEDVCVLGYGAFGDRCGPSVTSGTLSAVISVGNVPVMLQTSCAVHGGSSGGPVVASGSGELLGIVASNTRDNSTGATYPHLNFSIPITVLQSAVERYRKCGDLHSFQELNQAGHAVRDVWRLQRKHENVLQSKL
ncbi:peroxisomal leader peptide-processing protease [Discoglossus pictus]